MATTATLYATGASAVAGTWTNATGATGAPDATGTTAPTNCATWTDTARSSTATLELSGFGAAAQIPAGATINSVSATIPHAETSTTVINGLTAQLYSGTTAIGSAVAITRGTSLATFTANFVTMPTYAQLSDLRVRIVATRSNSTTSTTEYIDAVGVAVGWTVNVNAALTSSATLTATASCDLTVNAALTSSRVLTATVAPAVTVAASMTSSRVLTAVTPAPPAKASTLKGFTASDWIGLGANQRVVNNTMELDYVLPGQTHIVTSQKAYDLVGSSVAVRAGYDGSNGANEVWFGFGDNAPDDTSGNQLWMIASGGWLFCREQANGVRGTDAQIPYDPVKMAYWRIRANADTMFWETAQYANGPWTVQRSKGQAWTPSAQYIRLAGWNYSASAPGYATFSYLNQNPPASTLTDRFDTLDLSKWWTAGSGVTTANGRLVVPLNPSSPQVGTVSRYDITNSSVSFELVQKPSGSGYTDFWMVLWVYARADPSHQYSIELDIENGEVLSAYDTLSGDWAQYPLGTFDPVAQRFWRFTCDNSQNLRIQVSPDGRAWATLHTWTDTTYDPTSVGIGFGSLADVDSGMSVLVDNVNVQPKIETLTESFDTADTSKWKFDPNATVTGGQLRLTTSSAYEGATSRVRYDLTESAVTVEVPQSTAAGAGTVDTSLVLQDVPDSNVSFTVEGNLLYAQVDIAGNLNTIRWGNYSPIDHRWWRISETAGVLTFSVSPDGKVWSSYGTWTRTTELNISAMQVVLETGFWGTESAPGVAVFDNLNVAPVDGSTANASLTSSSTLTVTVSPSRTVAAPLVGGSTLTATGTASKTVAVSLTSAGTLTATTTPGATAAAGLASGSTLTATVTPSKTAVASLSSGSTLTATTSGNGTAAANLVSSSTLTATVTSNITAAASLTSNSTLTAAGGVTANASLVSGSTLTATTSSTVTVAATLTSAGTLTATTTRSLTVSASLTSAGTLTTTTTRNLTVSANLASAATVAATATPSKTVSASLSSGTTLAATTAASLTVAANMQAAYQLGATLGLPVPPSHVYGGATLLKVPPATAVLIGNGKSTATLVKEPLGTAKLQPAPAASAVLHTTD